MENTDDEQWPDDPFSLAVWLLGMGWTVRRILAECDRGLESVRVFISKHNPKNTEPMALYPKQLKHLGLIYVFVSQEHPIHVLLALDVVASPDTHPVTAYVYSELQRHYCIPKTLGAMTQCLRPDLLALVYKSWKHSRDVDALDESIQAACGRQWVLNPYAPITRCITGALAWCGAAVVETGRRTNADMVIGNAYYNMCYKDKAIAVLVMQCCCKSNNRVQRIFRDGPPPFNELSTNSCIVF